MAALFSAGSSSARTETSRNLIEFKAGKMSLKGTKVVADKRKGTFYIHRERETMLTHVCWKDRTSGMVEDDLIVFPDDCKWSRVSQCTTGRVYLLRFTSSSKKLFFWMQEPKDAKDDEYAEKINKILNEPDDPSNVQDMMPNMSSTSTEQLLSQMFGGGGSGTAQEQMLQQLFQSGALGSRLTAAGSGIAAGAGSRARSARASESEQAANRATSSKPVTSQNVTPMQMEQFQDIMSSLSSKGPQSAANLAAALPLDLSSILTSPEIIDRLSQHVPQEPTELIPDASAELRQSLSSPQFRQSLAMFSTAFSSGQLGPIITQFNLGQEATAAANGGNLKDFVEALNKAAKKETGSDAIADVDGAKNAEKDDKTGPKKDDDEKDDQNMDTST
ncbi:proteasomal ubiquitin receptor ADRM1-like [Convolutriloba macropyga]|uniref:proteasomal ubiquitin receptor ADRM1-like n=1 Tax=Convolutriloba macropyga TaxID=536237 RepID=UPI003F52116E